jgi:hypothetical protein
MRLPVSLDVLRERSFALQRNVPDHALSRISSFDWFGSVALNPIGYALIGPIAAAIGSSETLAIAGILNMATCVAVVLVPSVRGVRAHGPPTAEPADTAPALSERL